MTQPRYDESAQPRWFLECRHLVVCPRCNRRAVVEVTRWHFPYRLPSEVRLTCEHCGHGESKSYDSATWAGPVHVGVRSHCANCGQAIVRSIGYRVAPPRRRTIDLKCSGCGHITRRPLVITPAREWRPVDPHFGRPLWLQTACCGHVLWAANEGHLEMLTNYVGATLREREPKVKYSTVSRLPSWIKQAKHRRAVLKGLARLRAAAGFRPRGYGATWRGQITAVGR